LKIEASFVRSAAGATDFPRDTLAEIAMVGRSNVGKSSLINALVRQSVARTSAAPGKTRLANIYRVARGASGPLYLVDLPGYGYARGGAESAREFEELTRAYFGTVRADAGSPSGSATVRLKADTTSRSSVRGVRLQPDREQSGWPPPSLKRRRTAEASAEAGQPDRQVAAVLLVDARHPGLQSDLEAWRWLKGTVEASALVATKIDKLTRGERIRALREIQSVFGDPVLPVSAATGEGLDELWKLIDKLANNPNPTRPRTPRSRAEPAVPLPRKR
jgi:GTP-binding protein EngB required for normal cell division